MASRSGESSWTPLPVSLWILEEFEDNCSHCDDSLSSVIVIANRDPQRHSTASFTVFEDSEAHSISDPQFGQMISLFIDVTPPRGAPCRQSVVPTTLYSTTSNFRTLPDGSRRREGAQVSNVCSLSTRTLRALVHLPAYLKNIRVTRQFSEIPTWLSSNTRVPNFGDA